MHFVRASIISLIAGLVWTGQAAAINGHPAETAYLKIGDIRGTSPVSGYKDWFDVHGFTNASGKLVVYVSYNESATPLMNAEANRTHFDRATLAVVAPVKGEDKAIQVIQMHDVTVTLAYAMRGSPNCPATTDCLQATLAYSSSTTK